MFIKVLQTSAVRCSIFSIVLVKQYDCVILVYVHAAVSRQLQWLKSIWTVSNPLPLQSCFDKQAIHPELTPIERPYHLFAIPVSCPARSSVITEELLNLKQRQL